MTVGHPYTSLPDSAYWRRGVVEAGTEFTLTGQDYINITPETLVATAGSCFAQHIGRHLSAAGFNYLVTEQPHPIISQEIAHELGYGVFTARYGNIYTSLQLLQLIERSYGQFDPQEHVWEDEAGRLFDPYRPTIQPNGFGSVAELNHDRQAHLACVRRAFETLDVFVFTLGLTETWVSRRDGAAFPLCPGVAVGRFSADLHSFKNLRVAEVRHHLARFISLMRAVNPRARVLLTVSPVPLTATASGAHVLAATAYSKAVLRVAAQEVTEEIANVYYFPSFEIITGPQTAGRYYNSNLRDVTPEGVSVVMRAFLRAVAGDAPPATPQGVSAPRPQSPAHAAASTWMEAMCDETLLDYHKDGR